MSVGANIKKRRFELRMSQKELADAMGYKTRSTIAKIEAGENDVSQKKLQRFAEALDTTAEALITGNFSGFSSAPMADFRTAPKAAAPMELDEINQKDDPPTKTAVIILAGGKSGRNNQNIPSQFINIQGKPMLVYSLDVYQAHPSVDDIYIVCLKGWEDIVKAYIRQYRITKVRALIPGGTTGIGSLHNAIERIKHRYSPNDTIIIQEATRPMVNVETISKLLQACGECGSATISHTMNEYVQFSVTSTEGAPAASVGHTGKHHQKRQNVQYVDRNAVVALQSPEAHRLSLLLEVFQQAAKQQHPLTESCCTMLMYHLGYDINFIEGGINNIKIVREEDLKIFSTLVGS